MGLSYTSDDGPKMCFNAAKSWQTGWYSAKSTRVDPSGGTNSVADCLEQDLYGIVGYENPEALTVLIKINDPSSSTDHYVAFNRKAGFNSGTKEAPDQVTVVKAGIEDGSYSESDLMAKLDAGQQYSYKTESGQNVAVKVLSIDLNENKTRVIISKDGLSCNTLPPSPPPTPQLSPVVRFA
mmetsp:Transcript_21060/g.36224  ORF Transcript_21060/g.36224 Transcript_21060/m.36224 type:complete len:181 (-) Transcript_21060:1173-1715(-)